MGLIGFFFIYLFGGITFLPLLVAAILIPGWLLLPQVQGAGRSIEHDKSANVLADFADDEEAKERLKAAQEEKYIPDGAASATFAVLRSFSSQSANAALIAREKSNAHAAAVNGAVDGSTELKDGGSESVYQSMYRSVFDRTKGANTAPSVLENDDDTSTSGSGGGAARVKRKAVPATVYYIVLRHGHLMLYDSPVHVDVKHVISLAHHTISLSEGGPDDEVLMDADLFIKRTAIVLTPISLSNGAHQAPPTLSKPFYLFSANCSEKEDFYHALLATRNSPPMPQALIPEDLIKLQSTLHSSSLTPETRAFNALVSRIFLAVGRTAFLENLIRTKIEKKIARVQKPSFLASLAVQSIDLGDAAPVISNPRLKDLNITGDLTLSFDVKYNGGVRVGIAAVAKLDLGPRFKARTVDLVLATSLQRLSGHMLVRVKPPPSNRIWFCFENMPEMDIKVEPIVSTRQITYAFILRAIEERIRGVVAETLVKPNLDDVPFFDTRDQRIRGGIWSDEGAEEQVVPDGGRKLSAVTTSAAPDGLGAKNEKTMSMPSLPLTTAAGDTSASGIALKAASTASGISQDQGPESLKRRSVASLPLQPPPGKNNEQHMAKSLRSPSMTSVSPSAPSVAIDEGDVVPVRADDATLQPVARRLWRSQPQRASQQTRREAVDAVREMRDRTLQSPEKDAVSGDEIEQPSPAATGEEEVVTGPDSDETSLAEDSVSGRRPSDTLTKDGFSHPGIRSMRRTDSERSTATTSSSMSSTSAERRQQQRKNLLAATAAATNAARTWTWNAVANRNKGGPLMRGGPSPLHQQPQTGQAEPMGRGQPLPPPGMPLPGPQKQGIFGVPSLKGAGSVKRKPVKPALPPRRNAPALAQGHSVEEPQQGGRGVDAGAVAPNGDAHDADAVGQPVGEHVDDGEFGPWNENTAVDPMDDAMLGEGYHEEHSDASGDLSEQQLASKRRDEPDVAVSHDTPRKPKVPPPLPARRRSNAPHRPTPTISEPPEETGAFPQTAAPVPVQDEDVGTESEPTVIDPGNDFEERPNVSDVAKSAAEQKFVVGGDLAEEDFENGEQHETPAIDDKPADDAGGHTANPGHHGGITLVNTQANDGDEGLESNADADLAASSDTHRPANGSETSTTASAILTPVGQSEDEEEDDDHRAPAGDRPEVDTNDDDHGTHER